VIKVARPTALSYILNKKTDKLINANRKKKLAFSFMIPSAIVSFILCWYFISNISSFLDEWFLVSSSERILSVGEKLILSILLISLSCFTFFYLLWSKHSAKLEKYKKEIWELVHVEPFIHLYPCSCTDDYCIWLEKELGIELS
jgi:hypothetical protein